MRHKTAGVFSPFSGESLRDMLRLVDGDPPTVASRESHRLEFCETYSWNACMNKLRTFAALANKEGGYLVFGVKDSPRRLLGVGNFDSLEVEKLTAALNEHFSPEIEWDSYEYGIAGVSLGLIYVREARTKPVMCRKSNDKSECKEGEIYYRYRGRTERIKYSELRGIIEDLKATERQLWGKAIGRIGRIGVRNAAVLDSVTGEVTGASGSFLIDESLLPKIAFIRERHFTETQGTPTLKVIGEAQVIDSGLVQPTREIVKHTRGIFSPEIIEGFLRQEEVPDPTEYIKAICYQSSAYLPMFYYMERASLSIPDAITLVEQTRSTSATRKKLIERLRGKDGSALAKPPVKMRTALGDYSAVKNRLLSGLSGDGHVEMPLKETLRVMRCLSPAEIDAQRMLSLLNDWFADLYAAADPITRDEFRRAVCHLDRLLFAPGSPGSRGGIEGFTSQDRSAPTQGDDISQRQILGAEDHPRDVTVLPTAPDQRPLF